MSHPIRPESYIAMDNFYTATVYNKGAEVIRMYQTLLGRDGFRKGMDLYFQRHDGHAVSCDDFRAAMADANDRDLDQFEEWYLQPGTPQVKARSAWDTEAGAWKLTLKQIVGAGQAHLPQEKRCEKPTLIPIVVGLLDRSTGKEVVPSRVLELKEPEQTFTFEGLSSEVVPSLLRDFSAPVKLDYPYTDEELTFLLASDTDPFNRWEAGQTLFAKVIEEVYAAGEDAACALTDDFVNALRKILNDQETKDLRLLAYALILPSQATILERLTPPIDPVRLHKARSAVRKAVAVALKDDFEKRYMQLSPPPGEKVVIDGPSTGKRQLRNLCLGYLGSAKDAASVALAAAQFKEARERRCMTEKLAAMQILVESPDTPEAVEAVKLFYEDAKDDALVLNKWFQLQAEADLEDILERVKKLKEHPKFTLKNPNRLRSVISVFAGNVSGFHKADGSGYEFLANAILEVDKLNPQVASRLAKALSVWPKLDKPRQTLMKAQLAMLSGKQEELSKDTYEVVSAVSMATG